MTSPTVFVVDDDASIRRSLARFLDSEGLRAETFDSAQSFLDHASPQHPCCLVLDLRMPGLDGLDLLHCLEENRLGMPTIFMTGYGSVPLTVEAMKGGALDFLEKPFDDEVALAAIHQALERDVQTYERRDALSELRRRRKRLTPREHEVFVLVVAGFLNKQIASRLGTSEKTVKVHRARVMHKFEADSLAELARMAERLMSAEPEPVLT